MLRARLLVWLAVARALPVGDQTASDWAWGWWQSPPHLARTEAEPPLIVVEDAPRASPRPHARLAEATKAVTEELQRDAKEALERIDYWDLQKLVHDIEWTGPSPQPSPSPIPDGDWVAWFYDDERHWLLEPPSPSPIPSDDWVAWFYDDEQRASQRPRPHVPEDLTFMNAVDDWTPRMKREYLRELKSEREG